LEYIRIDEFALGKNIMLAKCFTKRIVRKRSTWFTRWRMVFIIIRWWFDQRGT